MRRLIRRFLLPAGMGLAVAMVVTGSMSLALARSRVDAAVDAAVIAVAINADPVVAATIGPQPAGNGGVLRTYVGKASRLPNALDCQNERGDRCNEFVRSSVLRWELPESTARTVAQKILDETVGPGRYDINQLAMTPDGRLTLEVTAMAPTPLARFLGPLGRVRAVGEVESRWAGEVAPGP